MGIRHGYTAQWRSDDNTPQHFKSHEGYFYNDRTDGQKTDYELDGSKLIENWYRGVRQGETVEYDADGNRIREAYYENGEPFTGAVEDRFANGTLKTSDSYEQGMRAGLSQVWYASGKLKSQTPYSDGQQSGPTLRYLESGEPDAATKVVLAKNIQQARKDSVEQIGQGTSTPLRKSPQQTAMEIQQAITAKREKTAELLSSSRNVLDNVLSLEERAREKDGTAGTFPPAVSAYSQIYDKLILAYETARLAPNNIDEEMAIAQRLLTAMKLAQDMYSGRNRELKQKIGSETQPDRILDLMEL